MRALDLFSGAGGSAVGLGAAGFEEIVGVDIQDQPSYPFQFSKFDALLVLEQLVMGGIFYTQVVTDLTVSRTFKLADFDFIWASPPCQAHTWSAKRWKNGTGGHEKVVYKDLVDATRKLLIRSGLPWVIENVPQANLQSPLILNGPSVGLIPRGKLPFHKEYKGKVVEKIPGIDRRRAFETSFEIKQPSLPNPKDYGSVRNGDFVTVAGHGGNGMADVNVWRAAMEIDWMHRRENETGDKANPGNREDIAESVPPKYAEFVGKAFLRLDGYL